MLQGGQLEEKLCFEMLARVESQVFYKKVSRTNTSNGF